MDREPSRVTPVRVPAAGQWLDGDLGLPPHPDGIVLFAHGSGSSRRSPRNQFVARALEQRGFATLLIDLLTPAEEAVDVRTTEFRFDIEMLAGNSHFNLYRFVKPWDHAAGTLMVEEAGGHAAHFNGDDYRPTVHQGGVLAATDPAAWHELHRLFLAEQLPLLDMTQDK